MKRSRKKSTGGRSWHGIPGLDLPPPPGGLHPGLSRGKSEERNVWNISRGLRAYTPDYT